MSGSNKDVVEYVYHFWLSHLGFLSSVGVLHYQKSSENLRPPQQHP